MIPTKARRLKAPKLPKNLERLYKQAKCRDCTVKVTRMDFAKILGKFTKVKIQYETNSTAKSRGLFQSTPNSRVKNYENGMVQIHRSAYNPHPARKLLGITKKTKNDSVSPRQTPNVLKENNRLKKAEQNIEYKNKKPLKHYGIVFVNPICKNNEARSKISLDTLLPSIDSNVLPSNEWCIDYFPKNGEPKDDKIYDRIAAELEDLMFNEKTKNNSDNKDDKNDEFPSILDILNDNSKEVTDKINDTNISGHLESSDVEAILLGKSKSTESMPMDIDNTDVSSLLTENTQITNKPNANDAEESDKPQEITVLDDNPNSPSILDENSQEVPVLSVAEKPSSSGMVDVSITTQAIDENDNNNTKNKNNVKMGVTQVIFKKTVNGTSSKTVICPKNLKYSISIQGKSIELLGAPKVISCLEDLQVLLEIVEESELTSLHVLH